MQESYNHKEVEARICQMWEKGDYFTPHIDPTKKPFSIFLVPPNASGGMHIGNVLMIACQSTLRDRDADGIVRKDGGCIEGNRFRREDVRNRIFV